MARPEVWDRQRAPELPRVLLQRAASRLALPRRRQAEQALAGLARMNWLPIDSLPPKAPLVESLRPREELVDSAPVDSVPVDPARVFRSPAAEPLVARGLAVWGATGLGLSLLPPPQLALPPGELMVAVVPVATAVELDSSVGRLVLVRIAETVRPSRRHAARRRRTLRQTQIEPLDLWTWRRPARARSDCLERLR